MPSGVGTTHHVKIGDEFCMLSPGGYRKRPAPTFGARISSGDPDYNNLSIWQHWVQTCWAGGIGADTWVDDSMYDIGVGTDSTVHEQLTLSRDLTRPTGGDSANLGTDKVRKFIMFDGSLYCVTMPLTDGTTSYLYKWTASTSTWAQVKAFTNWRVQAIAVWSGELVVGGDGNGELQSASNPSGSWTTRNPPTGVTGDVTAMGVYNQRLYVAYQKKVWRRKNDWTVDGDTVFYSADSADVINNFRVHAARLYFSSKNGHIFYTDSNSSFDVWSWDAHTYITRLQSYDGKLFVATYEYTDTTDLGQSALYQMSGSAMTQLKRFGEFDKATAMSGMVVYDRKLWYGASGLWGMHRNTSNTDLGGFGVAVYDAIEDSHSIWATNKDTTTYPDTSGVGRDWMVDDVCFFQGYMHVSVRKHGLFRSPVGYRDYLIARAKYDTTSTSATGTSSQGYVVSSDYDGGTPGLLKLWKQILVQCDLASDDMSVRISYSLNKGTTWTTAGTIARQITGTVATTVAGTGVVGTGTKFRTEVMPGDVMRFGTQTRTVQSVDSDTAITLTAAGGALQTGVAAIHDKIRHNRVLRLNNVRGPRMTYRMELLTSDSTKSPIVRGISVSYLPQPEPNWMWDLWVVISNKQELLDGTQEDVDTEARLEYFDDLFRRQEVFHFIDIDGVEWEIGGTGGVIMYDYGVDLHVPGRVGDREGLARLTLLETAESY